MREHKIRLNSIDDVRKFVKYANDYDFEIDLASGRYSVDGKSIMGIFSLDLSKVLVMRVHSEDDKCSEFIEDTSEFMVD